MKIPVFLHHHIAPCNYTPENFEAELKYLKENDYKTITLKELSDFLDGKKIYSKSIMLTFDDGYADNYVYAYPLLKKYGYNAVVFLATQYITDGKPRKTMLEGGKIPELVVKDKKNLDNFLRWDELKIMVSEGVFEVGSHTHTHKEFNKNSEYKNLKEELKISKELIKKNLGIDVISFAWPWGKFNDSYVEIAKECGYKLIFTTITGAVKQGDNPLFLKRINILPDRNFNWFKKRVKMHTLPLISDIYSNIYGIDRKIKRYFKKSSS